MKIATSFLALAFASGPLPALALDLPSFVDDLETALSYAGYPVEMGEARETAGGVVFDGVRISIGDQPSEWVDVEVTLDDVVEVDDAYLVGRLSVPDVDIRSLDGTDVALSWKAIAAMALRIPKDAPGPIDVMTMVQDFSTGPMALVMGGAEVLGFDGMRASAGFDVHADPVPEVQTTFWLRGLAVDMTPLAAADPKSFAEVSALGLDRFTGDVEQSVRWIADGGRVVLDRSRIDLEGLGSIDLRIDMTGFTEAVLSDIHDAQARMAAVVDDSEAYNRIEMELAARLLEAVAVSRFGVEIDDDGLMGRLMQAAAKEMGAGAAEYVDRLEGEMRAFVAGVAPGLAETLISPIAAFLREPGVLEIEVRADSPMNWLSFMERAGDLFSTGRADGVELAVSNR